MPGQVVVVMGMRTAVKHVLAALAASTLLVSFTACSDDGDGDPPPQVDAAPPPGVNGLGQTCAGPADCPAAPAHTCVFLTIGNPNTGYCSPVCDPNDVTTCTDGYNGPGVVACYTPNDATACSIDCTADPTGCPPDLTCVPTGGPFSFCTVAP